MTGGEFLRKLSKLARQRKVVFAFVPDKGKGSHGRAFYGRRSTTVKDRNKELGPGLLSDMCKQLGIAQRHL